MLLEDNSTSIKNTLTNYYSDFKNDPKLNNITTQLNFTNDNNFCCDTDLNVAYLSLPLLIIALVNGQILRSYHKSLDNHEKNIIVFLDIAITNFLQEIKVFFIL